MSRFEERAREALQDPEVAAAYWETDAQLQVVRALDALREQAHLTTEDLAQRMGRHRSAVARLLNRPDPNPRLDTLIALFAALGVTAELRIRRAGEGEPPLQVVVDVAEPISS